MTTPSFNHPDVADFQAWLGHPPASGWAPEPVKVAKGEAAVLQKALAEADSLTAKISSLSPNARKARSEAAAKDFAAGGGVEVATADLAVLDGPRAKRLKATAKLRIPEVLGPCKPILRRLLIDLEGQAVLAAEGRFTAACAEFERFGVPLSENDPIAMGLMRRGATFRRHRSVLDLQPLQPGAVRIVMKIHLFQRGGQKE